MHVCEHIIALQLLTTFTNKTVLHFGIDDLLISRIFSYFCFEHFVAIHAIESEEPSFRWVIREDSFCNNSCALIDRQFRLKLNFGVIYCIRNFVAAAMLALRTLARRYQALDTEITALDSELDRLTATAAPRLLALFGVGPDVASALLIAAGDNPRRLRSEAAFSMLCGSSPIEASSGKTTRHRLNRGGDRQANAALYRIVIVRLRWHQPTKDYMARRTTEGKSKKEIIRCLKRYVAREVFAVLREMNQADPATAA